MSIVLIFTFAAVSSLAGRPIIQMLPQICEVFVGDRFGASRAESSSHWIATPVVELQQKQQKPQCVHLIKFSQVFFRCKWPARSHIGRKITRWQGWKISTQKAHVQPTLSPFVIRRSLHLSRAPAHNRPLAGATKHTSTPRRYHRYFQ